MNHYLLGKQLSTELKYNIKFNNERILNWICAQFCYKIMRSNEDLSIEKQHQLQQFIKHLIW